MIRESLLNDTMTELNYARLKRVFRQPGGEYFVYRKVGGNESVKHFLYFWLYGNKKQYLVCEYGIKNQLADTFAIESIQGYGGDLYKLIKYDNEVDCIMRFSFGRLASWPTRSSLYIDDALDEAIVKRISDDLKEILFPAIENVASLDTLLGLLLGDANHCPWSLLNGAMRAALIINIAWQVGAPAEYILDSLRPHYESIKIHLQRGPVQDPGSYAELLVRDLYNANSRPTESIWPYRG
jgi:hypothetical protein